MDQAERAARIEAAEVRNEINARAIYSLQQQMVRIGQATKLVQIGSRVFNPAQIVIVYLGTESVAVNFAVQDGDQPLEIIFRDNPRLDFLAWLREQTVTSPINQGCADCPLGKRCGNV